MINWVASFPKSGSTFVRLALQGYFMGHVDINGALITEFDSARYYYKALSPGVIEQPELNIYLRPAVLLHMIEAKRFSPLMVKTHWANVTINGIRACPPELSRTAVCIVRDPRDIAPSFAKHVGKNLDETIDDMNQHDNVLMDHEIHTGTWVTTWSNHVESWINEDVPYVRYEDLRYDPENAFKDVLEAMKIKLNKKKLKRAVELTRLSRLMAQESEQGRFVEIGKQDKFFGQGKGWRKELTDDQVARIERDHGTVMKRLGYTLHSKAQAA